MAISLRNIANAQYGALTGRKIRYPYSSVILSQLPAVRAGILNKAEEDLKKEELEQSTKQFEKQLAQEKEQFNISLADTAKRHAETLARQDEALSESKRQAEKGTAIQLGGLGLGGTYVGSKIFGKTAEDVGKKAVENLAETMAPEALATESAPTLAGFEETLTGATPQPTAPSGDAAAPSASTSQAKTFGSGFKTGDLSLAEAAALYAAGDIWGKTTDKVKEIPRGMKTGGEYTAKYAAAGSSAGPVGTIVGATIGAIIGLGEEAGIKETEKLTEPIDFVESAVSKVLDPIRSAPIIEDIPIIGKSGGTWLCTEIGRHAGLSTEDHALLGRLRRYSVRNHLGWIRAYWNEGAKLVAAINHKENAPEFYRGLKESLVAPVIRLMRESKPDEAYRLYKEITCKLFEKYTPAIEIKEA
jgi:hypothetical protein